MTPHSDWHKPRPEHLPRPSYAPPIMAAGITCILWGAVTAWMVSVLGVALVALASVQWIGSLRYGK